MLGSLVQVLEWIRLSSDPTKLALINDLFEKNKVVLKYLMGQASYAKPSLAQDNIYLRYDKEEFRTD